MHGLDVYIHKIRFFENEKIKELKVIFSHTIILYDKMKLLHLVLKNQFPRRFLA
jgi:hypothetical protein